MFNTVVSHNENNDSTRRIRDISVFFAKVLKIRQAIKRSQARKSRTIVIIANPVNYLAGVVHDTLKRPGIES